MDDMRELIDLPTANALVRWAAIGLLVAGPLLGAAVGALRRRLGRDALAGLAIGLCGPLLWAMWRMFNAITDRYGLDSVNGLLINLAIFAAIGAAIGVGVGLALRKTRGGDSRAQ